MPPPNDPTAKPSPAAGTPPPDSGRPTPHPRYDEALEGDAFEVMRKYQVVTLPPNARLKLMQMKLPEAEPGVLEDTVPPNGGVTAPAGTPYVAAEAGVATRREATTEAPVVEGSREQQTVLVPRVRSKRRLRAITIGVVGAAVALMIVAFAITRTQDGNVSSDGRSSLAARSGVDNTLPAMESAARTSAPPATTEYEQVASKPAPLTSSMPSDNRSAPSKPSTKSTSATRAPGTKPAAAPAPKIPGATPNSGSAFDGPIRPPSE